jgi:pyruvate dehydrogenase E1 component alpha subunit
MKLDRDHTMHLLRQMIRIRRLEEKCIELYSATEIRGFLHLYIGEEAVAVGMMESIAPEDAIVATYREHGHALVRGVSARRIMAEMLGKQAGCSRGRGGSMHLFDRETRFYGGNAIVGGGLPLAVGLALAAKMQKQSSIACCFFGEGAVAEGEFHESMNLASLWKLPVLFACENNLYAMGTALARSESVLDLAAKAAGYGVTSAAVDGMNVLEVEQAGRSAVEAVRSGQGPFFLELRTYRFRAHSMFDPELYRTKEEVERWKEKDPITGLENLMREQGLLDDRELAKIEGQVEEEIRDAVDFSRQAPPESVEDLSRFVYSDAKGVRP